MTGSRWSRLAIRSESLAVLALLMIALSILSPYFLSVSNFLNILLATSVIGVLACSLALLADALQDCGAALFEFPVWAVAARI